MAPVVPVPTNYAEYKFYMDIVVLVAVICNSGYTWWSNREKVTSQRFVALEKEVAERIKSTDLDKVTEQRDKQCREHKQQAKETEQAHVTRLFDNEKKVERIGAEIRNLPQHRHIMELSTRVEQLHGDVHEVSGSLKGLSRAVDLMNEFLINQGGKR